MRAGVHETAVPVEGMSRLVCLPLHVLFGFNSSKRFPQSCKLLICYSQIRKQASQSRCLHVQASFVQQPCWKKFEIDDKEILFGTPEEVRRSPPPAQTLLQHAVGKMVGGLAADAEPPCQKILA